MKKEKFKNKTKYALLGVILIVMILLAYAPAIHYFCEEFKECKNSNIFLAYDFFINRYQTLMTGLAAIFVAYLTFTAQSRQKREEVEARVKIFYLAFDDFFLQLRSAIQLELVQDNEYPNVIYISNESLNYLPREAPSYLMNLENWVGFSEDQFKALIPRRIKAKFIIELLNQSILEQRGSRAMIKKDVWEKFIENLKSSLKEDNIKYTH